MKRFLGVLAILVWSCAPSAAGAVPAQISSLFVLSDSLLDNGNSGLVSQDAVGDVFPPFPYFQGRFSNGPVAVEYLWKILNPGDNGFAASLAGGTNYAIGGATSGSASYQSVNPSVPEPLRTLYASYGNAWQLAAFELDNPLFDPDESLFLIWLGANDVFYYGATAELPGTVPGSSGGPDLISNAIANIVASVEFLADQGAKHFMVLNMPDLGAVPEFLGNAELTSLASTFNLNLSIALGALDAADAGIEILVYDAFTALNEIIANPAAYGLTVVDQACIANLLSGVCNLGNWNEWLFWDGVHPTTRVHQIIAEQLAEQLGVDNAPPPPRPAPIPALSDWGLILLIVLMLGLVWRERYRFRAR